MSVNKRSAINIPLSSYLANPVGNGLMTPAKYDEYIKQNCDDILNFISDEMLENWEQLLSIQLCPLRTPLNTKPHHSEQAKFYEDYLNQRLNVISKRLQEYQITTISNRQAVGTLPEMPSLENLQKLAAQYKGHTPAATSIKYMVQLMREIQTICKKLWQQRETMHKNISQIFEENIRIICTHVTKTIQEICPELEERLKTRKQIESQLQRAYAELQPIHYQQRLKFYGGVYAHAEEQVRMIKDLLNISRILLNQYDPRSDPQVLPETAANYTAAQECYRGLDKSINIWLKVLKARSEMDNPIAILPCILHDLQKWLEQFQKFFLFCVQEWLPKQPKPAHPLPPVQVIQQYQGQFEPESLRKPLQIPNSTSTLAWTVANNLSPVDAVPADETDDKELKRETTDQYEYVRNTAEKVNHITPKLLQDAQTYLAKLKQSTTKASTAAPKTAHIAGLLPLNPQIHSFYQNMHSYANQQLHQDQTLQQQIFARHSQLESAILTLSKQTENRLSERDLDKVFADYSESTKRVLTVLKDDAYHSQFHAQQYELEKRLRWIQDQQMLAQQQLDMMKPRIETQESLVESLNRVLVMLHQFSNEQGLQWLEFTKQERELCFTWKSARSNYQDRILAYRSETRFLLADQLENTKHELSKCLHQCFRDLAAGHQEHLNDLQTVVQEYQTEVGQHREMVDITHQKLLKFKLEDVSQEIVNLTDAMDFIIEQREILDWHEYKVRMQETLIMFAETIKSMLQSLFHDKPVEHYLKYLDEYCVKENNEGVLCVPCPRGCDVMTIASLPCCNQTWIQLAEFPSKIDGSAMMSNSKMAQKDAQNFILDYHGYKAEHTPLPEQQEAVGELIRNLNSYLK
jgi:hypothetical protein